MKYEVIKVLEEEKFRRLTGVKRSTFEKMIKILNEADKSKQGKGGRKPKLSLEERLLMALSVSANDKRALPQIMLVLNAVAN